MKEKWMIVRKGADYQTLSGNLRVDPVLVRIMRNRGLSTEEEMRDYLEGGIESLHDPHLLKDMDLAADILSRKIREQKRIRIIGDYDIDGIMSVYILYRGLLRCGAKADYEIPDRIRDGYGLNIQLVEKACAEGVDTILTCDNGISAVEQIAYAKSKGMTVIVTDHHEVPYEMDGDRKIEHLPPADALIDPKQMEDHYPWPGLCGAAVAYKLIRVLYEAMGIPAEEADVFLENAGFATIGDVMDLQGENRVLARLGIEAVRHTRNYGMKALIAQNELDPDQIKAHHIGFRIGPCFNASGRLETAKLSLELLLSDSLEEAIPRAIEITELNRQRKLMTEEAVRRAFDRIEEEGLTNDKVLVIDLPECHESLAGIVAGRVREAVNRPVLVITRGENCAKGSGRSIEAYSMFDELNKCAELFSKFGGHPMAAGFSLEEKNIPVLRSRLNEQTVLTEEDLLPVVRIDVDMPLDYANEELVDQLSRLEPFGKANEKPVFAWRNVRVTGLRVMGAAQNVVRLDLVSDQGRRIQGVCFHKTEELMEAISGKFGEDSLKELLKGHTKRDIRMHFCYYPDVNTYRGVSSLQLIITGFQ